MLRVVPPPPPPLPEPLQPANPAAKHANSSRPAAAYPSRWARRGHLRCSGAACCVNTNSRINRPTSGHKVSGGIRKRGWGVAKGINWESVVVSMAVQNADPELERVAGVGVQLAAAPRLLEPFLNCTVPVGPAPLLVVPTTAVRVTVPPEAMTVGLGVTVVVVVACVIVTDSVLLVELELKLLVASAEYVALRLYEPGTSWMG